VKALEKFKNPLIFTMVVLVFLNVVFFKYRTVYVGGESMQPTYKDGEWLVIEKINSLGEDWVPDRFDVVLIQTKSGEPLTKRIIGLPGDSLEIKEGIIFLNKKALQDPFGQGKIGLRLVDENNNYLKYWNGLKEGEPAYELTSQAKIIIPEGNVWVIGDNREMSWYGTLPIKNIKGLIIL